MPSSICGTKEYADSSSTSRATAASRDSSASRCPAGWLKRTPSEVSSSTSKNFPSRSMTAATGTFGFQIIYFTLQKQKRQGRPCLFQIRAYYLAAASAFFSSFFAFLAFFSFFAGLASSFFASALAGAAAAAAATGAAAFAASAATAEKETAANTAAISADNSLLIVNSKYLSRLINVYDTTVSAVITHCVSVWLTPQSGICLWCRGGELNPHARSEEHTSELQ